MALRLRNLHVGRFLPLKIFCLCVCGCAHTCGGAPWRLEEGIASHGAGVTDNYELIDMDTESQTAVGCLTSTEVLNP